MGRHAAQAGPFRARAYSTIAAARVDFPAPGGPASPRMTRRPRAAAASTTASRAASLVRATELVLPVAGGFEGDHVGGGPGLDDRADRVGVQERPDGAAAVPGLVGGAGQVPAVDAGQALDERGGGGRAGALHVDLAD